LTLNLVELPNEEHPNNSVPRDGNGKPVVVPEGGGKPIALIRTTTFIDCIEDKSTLSNWKQRQTLRGAALQPSILEAVEGLDPNDRADKAKLDALAERAADVAGSNEASTTGTRRHTLSEYVDRGEPLPAGTSDEDLRAMMLYLTATSVLRMHSVEQFVVCSELGVGGTYDRAAELLVPCRTKACDKLHIVDLKTGGAKAIDYGHLKMPSQFAIYSRGKKYDHTVHPAPDRSADEKAWQAWRRKKFTAEEAAKAYSPVGDVCQDWGVVIHLPQGGDDCRLYWADLQAGWDLALFAQEVRARRNTKGTLIPFDVDKAA
jgi:hypothetical protein